MATLFSNILVMVVLDPRADRDKVARLKGVLLKMQMSGEARLGAGRRPNGEGLKADGMVECGWQVVLEV